MKIVAYERWTAALEDQFGKAALFCVEPVRTEQTIDDVVRAADTPSGDPDKDKKNKAALAGLWVMDLSGSTPVLARKVGWGFFAVVVDDVGWQQPVTVEEPNPEDPTKTKNPTVGDVAAMIAVSPEGQVFVKTIEANRPIATGKGGSKLLELDRTSTSKGQKLAGNEVGGGYANSARIRGRIRDLATEIPFANTDGEIGWMPVESFFLNGDDKLGKATLATALTKLGLIRFGR